MRFLALTPLVLSARAQDPLGRIRVAQLQGVSGRNTVVHFLMKKGEGEE